LTPDTLPEGGHLGYTQGGEVATAPKGAGIWNVVLAVGNAVRPVANFNVITMLPFSAKQNGRVGLYYLGNWPRSAARSENQGAGRRVRNPEGFIEVTQKNADTPVSSTSSSAFPHA
jgi:hypothetical protein